MTSRVTVFACAPRYENWPGVISTDRHGRRWKDGAPYDPETDHLPYCELDAMRFEFPEDQPDECQACGEPCDGDFCRDCSPFGSEDLP